MGDLGSQTDKKKGVMLMAKGKEVIKGFRLTEDEAKLLSQSAAEAGLKESDYIRQCISKSPMEHIEIRILLHDVLTEINHIGVNINQIVKNNNSGLYLPSDKERLLAYMKRLSSSMSEVVKKLGNN